MGQGNGAGPAIWAVISSPILDMLRSAGFGTYFKTALSGETIRFVGYSFMDDTDLIQTAESSTESAYSVAEKMQAALDAWEGGIRATGGAIVPIKSHWYLIDFVWNKGKWRVATKNEREFSLSVLDTHGNCVKLDQLDPSEALVTLGVKLVPAGNNAPQVERMLEATVAWADKIRVGHLQRHKAWLAMTSTIWKTMEYPLNALTLSKVECETIMRPVLLAGLPNSGICRKIPRSLVFGPLELMGLGLRHMYTLQGIAQTGDMISHGHRHTITGKLYRASLESLILEVGMGPDVLDLNYKLYGSLATAPGLVKDTWGFVSEHNLHLEHDISFPLGRQQDCFLMRAFADAGYSLTSLHQLPRCRLYLQVSQLSDIINGDGWTVNRLLLNGNRDLSRPNSHDWPHQQYPPAADWKKWTLAIRDVFLDGGTYHLQQPLGDWLAKPSESWQWFYSPTETRLYHRSMSTWQVWIPHGRRNRTYCAFKPTSTMENSLPLDAIRATIDQGGFFVPSTGYAPSLPTPCPPTSLLDTINTCSPKLGWSMQNIQLCDDGILLVHIPCFF